MSDFLKIVGERIRAIRKEKGLTQEELAKLTAQHYSYIGGIERGERNISLESLDKILEALEIAPNYFFQFSHVDFESAEFEKQTILQTHLSLLANKTIEEIQLIHRITKDIFETYEKK
jgi:transcriptional regulator with XRE-family HTH domain